MENKFDESHDVTIGMDFKSKVMNIDGVDYKLALWDTAGAERFRSLTPSFYRKALGAILVYDIKSRESLVKLEAWFTELENYSDNPNISTIVVGNKIDEERVVSREEGLKFARKHRSLFLETSAKNDKFVADVFRDIVEKVSVRLKGHCCGDTLLSNEFDFSVLNCRLSHRNISRYTIMAIELMSARMAMKQRPRRVDVDLNLYVFL